MLFALRNREQRSGVRDQGSGKSTDPTRTVALLAVAIAGPGCRIPGGVMACYLLAGLAMAQVVVVRSWAPALRAAAGAALGIGLAAVYLFPQNLSSDGWISSR